MAALMRGVRHGCANSSRQVSPRPYHAFFALIWLGVLPTGRGDAQQTLRVAVSMTDSAAGGVFQSAFSSALRALGDLQVVSVAEDPNFVIEGVVLCDPPGCKDVLSYTASIRLYRPVRKAYAETVADTVLGVAGRLPRTVHRDSMAGNAAWFYLKGAEFTEGVWTVTWGRNRYEEAAREFVRRIDAGCFDKARALQRAVHSGDPDALAKYQSFVASRTWMC